MKIRKICFLQIQEFRLLKSSNLLITNLELSDSLLEALSNKKKLRVVEFLHPGCFIKDVSVLERFNVLHKVSHIYVRAEGPGQRIRDVFENIVGLLFLKIQGCTLFEFRFHYY